jgi:phosphoribosylformylglycinamidine synthase
MSQARILILRAPGTNCDQETAFAFQQAGGAAQVVHINRLLDDPAQADQFQILCLPGGFSYGDDIAAGRIVAGQIRHHLLDTIRRFRDAGKLILGICNGFQILLKSGILLPDDQPSASPATLTWNATGQFEDRWVHLRSEPGPCVFLRDIPRMYLPVAHAEGKFVFRDRDTQQRLARRGQLALRYACAHQADQPFGSGHEQGELPFPCNPNGSQANVAGVCDETGRIFGLMPHPERHIHSTQHPQWTRRQDECRADGLRIFSNAVSYFE